MKINHLASLSLLALAASLPVSAQSFVFPTSYSFDTVTAVGAFDYKDDTHNPPSQPLGQLTDTFKGGNNLRTDLGNGQAYEWVAWQDGAPTISFTFATSMSIDSVTIGFNRDSTASTALPTTVTIGGTPFSVSATAIPNITRGDLTFSGSWTGSTLDVQLTRGGTFVFVDEFQFSGTLAPVPEPQWTMAAVGAALAGFAAWRQRR